MPKNSKKLTRKQGKLAISCGQKKDTEDEVIEIQQKVKQRRRPIQYKIIDENLIEIEFQEINHPKKKVKEIQIEQQYYPDHPTIEFPQFLQENLLNTIASIFKRCQINDIETYIQRFYINPVNKSQLYRQLKLLEEEGIVLEHDGLYTVNHKFKPKIPQPIIYQDNIQIDDPVQQVVRDDLSIQGSQNQIIDQGRDVHQIDILAKENSEPFTIS